MTSRPDIYGDDDVAVDRYLRQIGSWTYPFVRRAARLSIADLPALDAYLNPTRVDPDDVNVFETWCILIGGTTADGPPEETIAAVRACGRMRPRDAELVAKWRGWVIDSGYSCLAILSAYGIEEGVVERAEELDVLIDLHERPDWLTLTP